MKTVRVGLGRLYNARSCTLLGRKEIAMRFRFGKIDVQAYVGPKTRHIVMAMKVGPEEPIDETLRSNHVTREREYAIPSPEIFPADLYTELVATQLIEVEDNLASSFHDRDEKARHEIFRRAKKDQGQFSNALDCTAGILGLRLHHLLVTVPILEQCYAYREKGGSYAVSLEMNYTVTDSFDWDLSADGIVLVRKRLPRLQPKWKWEKASEVLAWLLRAWATQDSILKFASLFIPLECVIPATSKETVKEPAQMEWESNRQEIISLVNKHTNHNLRKKLNGFLTGLKRPPPLSERFKCWASAAKLPGWKNDVAAFQRFYRIRNSLVHRGDPDVKFRVTVELDDVRTLEDITERYVSLALFGDASVYQSKKRPQLRNSKQAD